MGQSLTPPEEVVQAHRFGAAVEKEPDKLVPLTIVENEPT
jgi:hypothetical protein